MQKSLERTPSVYVERKSATSVREIQNLPDAINAGSSENTEGIRLAPRVQIRPILCVSEGVHSGLGKLVLQGTCNAQCKVPIKRFKPGVLVPILCNVGAHLHAIPGPCQAHLEAVFAAITEFSPVQISKLTMLNREYHTMDA